MAIIASAMTTTAGWRLAVESIFAGTRVRRSIRRELVFFVTGITAARNAGHDSQVNLHIDDDEDGTPGEGVALFDWISPGCGGGRKVPDEVCARVVPMSD